MRKVPTFWKDETKCSLRYLPTFVGQGVHTDRLGVVSGEAGVFEVAGDVQDERELRPLLGAWLAASVGVADELDLGAVVVAAGLGRPAGASHTSHCLLSLLSGRTFGSGGVISLAILTWAARRSSIIAASSSAVGRRDLRRLDLRRSDFREREHRIGGCAQARPIRERGGSSDFGRVSATGITAAFGAAGVSGRGARATASSPAGTSADSPERRLTVSVMMTESVNAPAAAIGPQ